MPKRLPKSARQLVSFLRQYWLVVLFFAGWFGYLTYFWIFATEFDEFGNFFVGHVSIWGDWAAHFTMGSAMAERGLFLRESPFLAGASFSYPFVANLISATVIRLGMPFFSAFLVPSYIASLALITAVFWFFKTIMKSSKWAVIAALLLLLNGGIGFIHYYADIVASDQPYETFINPPREYTSMQDEYIRWISVVNSMVVPQRAFTLGFPVTLLLLGLVWKWWFNDSEPKRKQREESLIDHMILGVGFGFLPILHTHSFLASFVILACWSLAYFSDGTKRQLKHRFLRVILLGATSAIIAVPLLLNLFFTNVSTEFASWFPGWYLQEFTDVDWFTFWFKNWGIVPVLAVVGAGLLLTKVKEKKDILSAFFKAMPFFVLFAALNLFLFQPFIWDNTKLLVWAAVGFSWLTTLVFQRLWHQRKKVKKLLLRPIVIVIFIFSILSGGIDAWRMIRFDVHWYQMYSAEELEMAKWVKENTPKDSLWLTGDRHNHPIYNLTGRQPLLTFRGWLWTHGYDYGPTESAVHKMFQNPDELNLFWQRGVDYILLGEKERSDWGANRHRFDQHHTLVFESENYQIYSVGTEPEL